LFLIPAKTLRDLERRSHLTGAASKYVEVRLGIITLTLHIKMER